MPVTSAKEQTAIVFDVPGITITNLLTGNPGKTIAFEIVDSHHLVAQKQQEEAKKSLRSKMPTKADKDWVRVIAYQMTVEVFGQEQWPYMDDLIMRESAYDPNIKNLKSGACGIPQALPCSKIKDKSVPGQLAWMISYIKDRYGNPANAIAWHNSHHWY